MIAFIDDHREVHGVEPICKVLPITPSTYREGLVMSGWRPLIKGYFSALRWSWVRSCLRPVTRRIESAGPDVVR